MREDLNQKRFIQETYRIVKDEGMEAVSIRRVAQELQCNSASIYQYFADLDELLCYVALRFLTEYLQDVAEGFRRSESSLETYVMIWDMFSLHAFRHPQMVGNLFFGKHSGVLTPIIRNYYELFPEDLREMDDSLKRVFLDGSFRERDRHAISRCVEDGYFAAEDAELINLIVVHMFEGYLDELRGGEMEDEKRLRTSFLDCVRKLVEKYRLK